jgi:hypothetical protein
MPTTGLGDRQEKHLKSCRPKSSQTHTSRVLQAQSRFAPCCRHRYPSAQRNRLPGQTCHSIKDRETLAGLDTEIRTPLVTRGELDVE